MPTPHVSGSPCPRCDAPLVEIELSAAGLVMRSCSRCDGRWWSRLEGNGRREGGQEPAAGIDAVLDSIAESDAARRSA